MNIFNIFGKKVHAHWQNLGDEEHVPRHGRAWLHVYDKNEQEIARFSAEWSLFAKQSSIGASVSLSRYDDETLNWSIRVPFIGLYFGVDHATLKLIAKRLIKDYEPRELALTAHDGSLWWRVWSSPMSWKSGTPKWRDGNFNPADFVFGENVK